MAGALTITIILAIFFVAGGAASYGFRVARDRRRALKQLRQSWTAHQQPRPSRGRSRLRAG
jgi:hypothetical protein